VRTCSKWNSRMNQCVVRSGCVSDVRVVQRMILGSSVEHYERLTSAPAVEAGRARWAGPLGRPRRSARREVHPAAHAVLRSLGVGHHGEGAGGHAGTSRHSGGRGQERSL
jgi:hypothetical protein